MGIFSPYIGLTYFHHFEPALQNRPTRWVPLYLQPPWLPTKFSRCVHRLRAFWAEGAPSWRNSFRAWRPSSCFFLSCCWLVSAGAAARRSPAAFGTLCLSWPKRGSSAGRFLPPTGRPAGRRPEPLPRPLSLKQGFQAGGRPPGLSGQSSVGSPAPSIEK